jgi:hypothetical protein
MRKKGKGKRRKVWFFSLFTFHFSLFPLSSCTFLYIPPELPVQTVPAMLELSGSSGLSYDGNKLELSVFLRNVPEAGWLSVQWYSPRNTQAASDSVWIEQRDEGLTQTFALPQPPSEGEWRVVVSFGDAVLRQFSLEVR